MTALEAAGPRWHVGHVLLSMVALVLAGLGRSAYAVCAGVSLCCVWCVTAVRVGWDDGRQADARRRVAG